MNKSNQQLPAAELKTSLSARLAASSPERLSLLQRWSVAARLAGFSSRNLAKLYQVSSRQMERCCRKDLGRSPEEWLNEQRIVAARKLLLEKTSIKGVSLDLGFTDVSLFCRHFKRYHGMTPSAFIALHSRFNRL